MPPTISDLLRALECMEYAHQILRDRGLDTCFVDLQITYTLRIINEIVQN